MILQKEPKKSLIIRFINLIICIIILGIGLYCVSRLDYEISPVFILVSDLVVFLGGLLISYMSYITRGIHLSKDKLTISYGIFAKKISIIKYGKVQYINIRENLISSRLNLCKGEIYILASLGNDMRTIGYYDECLFEKLGNKIINII